MSMATEFRHWPSVLAFALVATTLTWVTTTVVEPPGPARAAVSGSLTGLVFHDYNVDGARQVDPPANFTEAGIGGVVVSAYDSTGALVATTTSAANGTYTLLITSAATNDVRVEFDTPAGYQPSFVGSGAGVSVQFTTVAATNVNYAVQIADEFCQANPTIMSTCFYPGGLQFNPTLGSLRSTTWTGRTAADTRLEKQATGSLWGVAVRRTTGLVFPSAAIRRPSALGPEGLGGLYVTTPGVPLRSRRST